MTEFECWFCGKNIERADAAAVTMTVENLWLWADDSRSVDNPVQRLFAHADCAKDRLRGAQMELEPELLGEGE